MKSMWIMSGLFLVLLLGTCTTSTDPVIISPDGSIISACVGDNLNFICTTKNKRFTIGYWTSREYIGSTGQQLEFGSRQQLNQTKNSTIDDSTFATLVAAYEENGLTVLKIKLQFTVSVAAEFICGIEGHEKNITLILGSNCAATADMPESPCISNQQEDVSTLTTTSSRGFGFSQGYTGTFMSLVLVRLLI